MTFSKWNYSIFPSRFSIWISLSRHSFWEEEGKCIDFKIIATEKRCFKLNILIIEKANEKLLFNSVHFFFNTNLVLIFSEFIFYFSLQPPTTLSRRLYIIHVLQNALGTKLQRLCELSACGKQEWAKTFTTTMSQIILTPQLPNYMFRIRENIQFCCTSWIAAQTTYCHATRHFSLCFILAKRANEPLDFMRFFFLSQMRNIMLRLLPCSVHSEKLDSFATWEQLSKQCLMSSIWGKNNYSIMLCTATVRVCQCFSVKSVD